MPWRCTSVAIPLSAACWAAVVAVSPRRTAVHAQAEAAIVATEQGFAQWAALGTSLRVGAGYAGPGEWHGTAPPGTTTWRATGATLNVPYLCTLLADVCDHLGRPADGLQTWLRSTRWWSSAEERYWEAEAHRLRGVCSSAADGDAAGSEAWLQRP